MAFWVWIEAKRIAVVDLSDEEVPQIKQVQRQGGHSLIPVAVLVGLLIYGYTPTYAAGPSIAAVVVAPWLSPKSMGPWTIFEAMALGARNMIGTAVLLVAVGIIVSVLGTSGIYFLTTAIEGCAEPPLTWPARMVLGVMGVVLLWSFDAVWKIGAFGLAAIVVFASYRLAKQAAARTR